MTTHRKSRSQDGRALLLANIGQLLTLRSRSGKAGPRRGVDLGELGVIEDGAVLCVGGKIVSVGTTKDALADPWLKKNRKKITEVDCAGQVVLPGFVDSHTHPVFVEPRLVDFDKRIAGATVLTMYWRTLPPAASYARIAQSRSALPVQTKFAVSYPG